MDQWRIGGDGRFRIDDNGQRIVVNIDQGGRVFGEVRRGGHHCGDRLTLVAHGCVSEDRPRGGVKSGEPCVGPDRVDAPGEIGSGHDGNHAGGRAGRGDVNAGDAGMGEGTAHKGDVERVRERDVGHKAPTSQQQARVFPSPHGRSHV